MAVSRLATITGNRVTGSSASLAATATCNAASSDKNTVAVVGVVQSVSTNSADTTCTVTYGGVTMRQFCLDLFGTTTNRGAISLYFLHNPPTGAQNVIATSGGASTKTAIALGGAVYSGAAGVAWLAVASALSSSLSNVLSGAMGFSVACNGAAITSPNQTSLYLAGSLVTGLADYISVQDGSPSGTSVSFTNAGTATTPRIRQVVILPSAAKANTLTDDFATKDTAKWSWNGAAAVSGGQLVLACASTYANQIDTAGKAVYDLTDSEVVVEAVTRPNVGTGTTEMYLEAQSSPWGTVFNGTMFIVSDAQIYFTEVVSGVQDNVTITYNATDHRWWRIRHSGSTVYWDTSPDGITWTNRRNKTSALPLTGIMPIMYCGYYGTETTPGNAVYDNFNLAPSVGVTPNTGFFQLF